MKYFSQLGIYLTYNCNLMCRHCSQKGTLDRSLAMDHDLLISTLKQAAEIGVEHIALSGGEPFLSNGSLSIASEFCWKAGIKCTVVTSGWWAKTEMRCYKKLVKLRGITGISLSWDEWHAEYIPVERIRNVVSTCKKLEIDIEISGCYITCAEEAISWIKQSVGPDLCQDVEVHAQPILFRGAVRDHFFVSDLPSHEIWKGGCRAANSPVVLPDGTVYACCGGAQDIGGDSFLNLGTVRLQSLAEVRERAKNDLIVQTVRKFGPEALYLGGREEVLESLAKQPAYKQCNLCVEVSRSEALKEHISELSANAEYLEFVQNSHKEDLY